MRVTQGRAERVRDWPIVSEVAPAGGVYDLANVGIFDDDGLLYDPRTRRAFAETLHYWNLTASRHPGLALPRVLPKRELTGHSVFLCALGGQTFYHFLLDVLPQIELMGEQCRYADRIIVQSHIEPRKKDWLARLGLRLPIEWLKPLAHIHCERLTFCTRLNPLNFPAPRAVQVLRRLTAADERPSKNRSRFIWAARRGTTARPNAWESKLLTELPAPWEVVDFSTLAPDETMETLATCRVFGGLHGAAFANLALAPRGIDVLEVFTQPNEAWFPVLSSYLDNDHRILFAESAADVNRKLAEFAS